MPVTMKAVDDDAAADDADNDVVAGSWYSFPASIAIVMISFCL